MSGCDVDGQVIRKGAVDAVADLRPVELGGKVPAEIREIAERIGDEGGTPLAVADGNAAAGHHPSEGHGQGRHDASDSPASARWEFAR